MRISRTLVFCIFLTVSGVPGLAGTDPSAMKLLEASAAQTDLRDGNAIPFLLQADFHAQINTLTDGHVTWLWMRKDLWSWDVKMGDYHETRVRKGESLYIARNAPVSPGRVLQLVRLLQIMPEAPAELKIDKVRRRNESGMPLSCLEIQRAVSERKEENTKRKVCIDSANQIVSEQTNDEDRGDEQFADFRQFGDHKYPWGMTLKSGRSLLLSMNVTSLRPSKLEESLLVPPAKAIIRRQCDNIKHPQPVKIPDPEYPGPVSAQPSDRTVMVALTVETDGSVSDIQLTKSQGNAMDEATKKTLSTWKFKPAMCGTDPVAYDIQVEVTFHSR